MTATPFSEHRRIWHNPDSSHNESLCNSQPRSVEGQLFPRSLSHESIIESTAQSRLLNKFAELQDAIHFGTQNRGFILSADEKFAYPNVRAGEPLPELVEIDDVETFFERWSCWDELFTRRMTFSELPAIRLSRNREPFRSYPVGVLSEDGRRIVFDARGELLYAQGNREYLGGVVWFTELGDFETLEAQKLEQSLRSFETICDSLPHMVWTSTADGMIDYFSRSWYESTGRSPEQSLGHTWREGIHPDDLGETWAAFGKAMAFGRETETQYRYQRHDGVWRWMTARAKPRLAENGTVLRWYGTTTDIHELVIARDEAKQLEIENARLLTQEHAAKEGSRMKSQFLAHMSHELRTPIAGVMGMVELLKDTRMNAEQTDYADCIKTSAANLLTIVNDILDFSKIESGKLQIEAIPFTLFSMVEDVARVWSHVAQQKGLTFSTTSNVAKDLEIVGDPTRIGQILSNLCSNAIKFTSHGVISFEIEVVEKDEDVEAMIVVQDSGIGIEPKVLAQLFTPFSQGDTSTARLYGGTGLGLIISRNLAQLMQGRLVLESASSKGTKAILVLTMKKVCKSATTFGQKPADNSSSQSNLRNRPMIVTTTSAPFAIPIPASAKIEAGKLVVERPILRRVQTGANFGKQEQAFRLKGLQMPKTMNEERSDIMVDDARRGTTVLIVEDNSINQRIAIKTVEKLGFTTRAASNGQEALDYLSTNKDVDVVLMDCQMPILDGYEATRQIRTGENLSNLDMKERRTVGQDFLHNGQRKLKDIPVIALTASAIPGDQEKCFDAGMSDYLTKPLDVTKLETKIIKWASV